MTQNATMARPISPIRNDEQLHESIKRVEQLMHRADLDSDEEAELDALATLIVAYEAEHFPMDMPSPINAILFRIEQAGLTRKDLEPMIGSRARVSEVLSGKRALTLPMIRRLTAGLGIPADVLIQPMPVTKSPRKAKPRTTAPTPRPGRSAAATS